MRMRASDHLRAVLNVINQEKDGSFFVCSEAGEVIAAALGFLDRQPDIPDKRDREIVEQWARDRYCTDDIEIDGDLSERPECFSEAGDGGVWVQAWLYVPPAGKEW